jgi:ABC-type lipoprotein release transport system permease subunit
MEDAGVRVGDEVTLAVDADGRRAATFRVVGAYEPVPDPKKFSARRLEAHLHLPDLVNLTQNPNVPESADQVSALNLSLVNPAEGEAVASTIGRRLPGTIAQPTRRQGGHNDPFAVIERFHEAIALVTVTGSTAFLLALMVMRAEERREIIGILRLMGISTRSILLEVVLEGLLIAVAGAIFGILVAAAAQSLVNRFFQWRYDTTLVFVRVTPSIAWRALAFAIPLGILAGLGASWTLLRRSVISLVGR